MKLRKKPASPGRGWRFVEVGEELAAGDEVWRTETGWKPIKPAVVRVGLVVEDPDSTYCTYGYYRRRVKQVHTTDSCKK